MDKKMVVVSLVLYLVLYTHALPQQLTHAQKRTKAW